MRPGRLHLTGASGTGTTTLGRAVATAWSVPHADTDDYFWAPTDPPYTTKRPEAERLELMEALFLPRPAWVLSGSLMGWGDALTDRFDAVVFLTLEPGVRLQRLAARERQRYGAAVEDQPAHHAFMYWASGYDDPAFDGRSRVQHEAWLAGLTCPVLRLEASAPTEELLRQVLES